MYFKNNGKRYMELHNLKDRLVLLKEYGKLDYEWEKLYAGSLVIKKL